MRQLLRRFVDGHKLFVLVAGVIVISCVLVGISMTLYYRSDAYRIDLSRPEFKDSRKQIVTSNEQESDFPATGEITDETLADFYKRYDNLSKQIFDSKAFSADVLSDEELDLSAR